MEPMQIPDDFPSTLTEFEDRFNTERACHTFLANMRWPDGFKCPKCEAKRGWTLRERDLIECANCGHQTSVTAGTIFHGTRKPLRTWFRAMFLMMAQKHGISALGLKRLMGFGSYQTAWCWLHKLRTVMVRRDRPRLAGKVEVDEAFIGGTVEGISGRGSPNPLVAVAVERVSSDPLKLGRARMEVVEDASDPSLVAFVAANVEPKAEVLTDGLASYKHVGDVGVDHKPEVIGRDPKRASIVLPAVHLVISLLKRWLLGTFQGAVSDLLLPRYLDEFIFRFNRKTAAHVGKLFFRLVEQGVTSGPSFYKTLHAPEPDPTPF